MTRILLIFMLISTAALAQRDMPGALALEAAAQLDAAHLKLAEADTARDRVQALTEAIQAYEVGLEALREGLRQASIRQTQLEQSLVAREEEVAGLLAALQAIGPGGGPTTFLHPAGPAGTIRAGLLLAELTPALDRSAAELRSDLEDVVLLNDLQKDVAARLNAGLEEMQAARTALSQAIANRTDLPQRLTEDPVRTAILIASSETLDAFSASLDQIAVADAGWEPPDLNDVKGELPLPVLGVILRRPGEADAAGISRTGLLLATRPGALVAAPTAATIRYQGPLLDLGTVVILEPSPGILFVFAGLASTYGRTGQIVAAGTPLGLMGEGSKDGEGAGNARPETLYIETREHNASVDPLSWFRAPKDG